MVPFALETVAFTLSTVGPSFAVTRLAFSVRVCTFAVIWSILGDARAITGVGVGENGGHVLPIGLPSDIIHVRQDLPGVGRDVIEVHLERGDQRLCGLGDSCDLPLHIVHADRFLRRRRLTD